MTNELTKTQGLVNVKPFKGDDRPSEMFNSSILDKETASQTQGPKSVIPEHTSNQLLDQPLPPRIIPHTKKKAQISHRLGEQVSKPTRGFTDLKQVSMKY